MIEFETEGFAATAGALDRLEAAFLDLEPAWEEIDKVLEKGEREIFDEWDGKFVDTGRLERSLTESGGEAIRLAHAQEFQFGTRTRYARYQRDPKDRSRSAVLRLTGDEIVETGLAVMAYLRKMHGPGVNRGTVD